MVREPCIVCGEERAPGSPALQHELTEDELQRLRDNAFLFGVAFGASAH